MFELRTHGIQGNLASRLSMMCSRQRWVRPVGTTTGVPFILALSGMAYRGVDGASPKRLIVRRQWS